MSRRRVLTVCSALLALVAVAMVATHIPWARPPAVSRQECDQLKEGMTREEVEEVIGGPPGHYATREYLPSPDGSHYFKYDYWVGDEGMIFVHFDEGGRVSDAVHEDVWLWREPRRGRTFLDGLRASFGF